MVPRCTGTTESICNPGFEVLANNCMYLTILPSYQPNHTSCIRPCREPRNRESLHSPWQSFRGGKNSRHPPSSLTHPHPPQSSDYHFSNIIRKLSIYISYISILVVDYKQDLADLATKGKLLRLIDLSTYPPGTWMEMERVYSVPAGAK